MTSCTGKTKVRRALRKAAMGNKRKNAVRRDGTTSPLFALNKPTDSEKAKKGSKAVIKTAATVAKVAAPKKASAPKAAAAPKAAKAPAAKLK